MKRDTVMGFISDHAKPTLDGDVFSADPKSRAAILNAPEQGPDIAVDLVLKLAGEARQQGQLERARQICHEAILRIWHDHPNTKGLPIPAAPIASHHDIIDESGSAAIEAMVQAAFGQDVVWITHLVGNAYTHMLPSDLRSETGAFYTPPSLVALTIERSINCGVDLTSARCIDPAAGAGAFLVPLALKISSALAGADNAFVVQALRSRLRGRELDPFAAWMANVFIELAAIKYVQASGRRLGEIVFAGDTLEALPERKYDLVIGNPPFGRVRLPEHLRTRFAAGLYGHANLYGLFMHAAIDICADHGIVALITPTSYLGGQYFTNLRRLLIERAPPIAFDLVLQRRDVFRSVLQETAVSYFRKGGAPKKVEVSLVTIDGSAVVSGKVATLALPLQAGVPWPLPRGSEGVFLSKRMAKMATRLSDWGYRIKTGPLVWNRHRDEIAAAVSGRGLPIIWAEAVRNDGTVSLDYAKRDDKARIVPNAGHEWLITKQPCVLIQRTTAKEQSRRLIVSRLDDRFYEQHKNGVVVENHVNMLVPACDKPTIPIEVLAALFNTKIMDRVYRCISGSVAVSAYELENMPLPEAGSMTSFAEAVACGDNAVIEAEARKLFGERV